MRLSLLTGLLAACFVDAKIPYFIHTGDSTTAPGGGWGDGFQALKQNGAGGVNHAIGGATTASFKASGRWANALTSVRNNVANYEPIVTIQFGHNDQKETSGISLSQFQANMKQLATEVIQAGGTPIIISSLTRRVFSGNAVVENLAEHSAAAIAAAQSLGIQYLDLNRASTNYVNAIGKTNADYYNLAAGDRTHLNVAGEKVFARQVADLLVEKRSDVKSFLKQNTVMTNKIKAGQFATGDEA